MDIQIHSILVALLCVSPKLSPPVLSFFPLFFQCFFLLFCKQHQLLKTLDTTRYVRAHTCTFQMYNSQFTRPQWCILRKHLHCLCKIVAVAVLELLVTLIIHLLHDSGERILCTSSLESIGCYKQYITYIMDMDEREMKERWKRDENKGWK